MLNQKLKIQSHNTLISVFFLRIRTIAKARNTLLLEFPIPPNQHNIQINQKCQLDVAKKKYIIFSSKNVFCKAENSH
jgi:hypothetical protein